jgi:phenylalanyl-tRNA synthetase beta chain
MVALGLRETISYRLTTREREAMLLPPGISAPENAPGYIELANPIAADKSVLRHTLLTSLLENAINNQRYTNRLQIFEIGNVYFKREGQQLPDEPRRLGILLTGPRRAVGWTHDEPEANVDYFDLKGVVEGLVHGLHTSEIHYQRAEHPSFHLGRSAQIMMGKREIGTFGELHPLVTRAFGLTAAPILVAELDLDALLEQAQDRHPVQPLPTTPPVLQDIALVVNEETPAAAVEDVIVKAGGDLLKGVRLFDVYRGDPIPAGHKSLAYNLTYQTDERTLTDKEVAKVHQKIVKATERELGAKLRA